MMKFAIIVCVVMMSGVFGDSSIKQLEHTKKIGSKEIARTTSADITKRCMRPVNLRNSGGYAWCPCNCKGCSSGKNIIYSKKTKTCICTPQHVCNCKCGVNLPQFNGLTSLAMIDNKIQCNRCGGCFPASSSANLKSGKSIGMSELQVGDLVQTGANKYSEVRAFMKKQFPAMIMYTSITTVGNLTITLTGKHLIFARTNSAYKFIPINAEEISLGHEVLIQKNGDLVPAIVTKVAKHMMKGAFSPLTMDGTIMVDGVLASCYPHSNHDLAHIGTAAIRFFPQLIEWMFGKEDGAPAYLHVAKDFANKVFLPYELTSNIN